MAPLEIDASQPPNNERKRNAGQTLVNVLGISKELIKQPSRSKGQLTNMLILRTFDQYRLWAFVKKREVSLYGLDLWVMKSGIEWTTFSDAETERCSESSSPPPDRSLTKITPRDQPETSEQHSMNCCPSQRDTVEAHAKPRIDRSN